MSGGKTEGFSPDEGHNYLQHVNVVSNNTTNNMNIIGLVQNTKKIDIKSSSETYYPVISFSCNKRTDEIPNSVSEEIPKTEKKVEEPIKLMEVVNKTENTKRSGAKKWLSRIGTVVVSAVAICAVILVGLRLAGFRTFTVMSGSMSPEFPVGALIYVQPVDYKKLKEGDVISFVANDDKTVVTHRIAEVVVDPKDADVYRFRTKGDANNTTDAKLVHYKNVLGVPIITLPNIGYIAHNIQQPPGIYIALVVGTLLLAWTFLPGTLEERRKLRVRV